MMAPVSKEHMPRNFVLDFLDSSPTITGNSVFPLYSCHSCYAPFGHGNSWCTLCSPSFDHGRSVTVSLQKCYWCGLTWVLCSFQFETEIVGGKLRRDVLAEGSMGSGTAPAGIASLLSGQEEMFAFRRAVGYLILAHSLLHLSFWLVPFIHPTEYIFYSSPFLVIEMLLWWDDWENLQVFLIRDSEDLFV